MYMDEGLDTGDVLSQSHLPIAPDENGRSLHDRLAALAPVALKRALKELQAGTAPRISQNSAEATYASKLERDDGRINWSESAEQIERIIRAFEPWPGTYTVVSENAEQTRKLKIFSAKLERGGDQVPGQIVTANASGILIAAAGGLLRLGDVQLEGKKRMTAAECVRGHPWLARARTTSPA